MDLEFGYDSCAAAVLGVYCILLPLTKDSGGCGKVTKAEQQFCL